MSRSRAAALFMLVSVSVSAGVPCAAIGLFPDFFTAPRAEGVAIGTLLGWSVMLATFVILLFTIGGSHNVFLGGYVAGFLVRLASLGLAALLALGVKKPMEFVLVAVVGSYFVLFFIEAWVLSSLARFGASPGFGRSGGAADER